MVVQKDFQKTRLSKVAEQLPVEAPAGPVSLLIVVSALNLVRYKKEVVRKMSKFCK